MLYKPDNVNMLTVFLFIQMYFSGKIGNHVDNNSKIMFLVQ